jgi:lipopolysaccharide transport system ATP-binding protein
MSDVARAGRTIVFVSHSMAAVQSLCHRVLWLESGTLLREGAPGPVIRDYIRSSGSSGQSERSWKDLATAPGNERFRLQKARVRSIDGSEVLSIQSPIVLEFEYWNRVPDTHMHLSIMLQNEQGITVLNAEPLNETLWAGRPMPAGLFRDRCTIPAHLLNDGTYHIDLLVARDEGNLLFRIDRVLQFDVHDLAERQRPWYGKWAGVVRPSLEWKTELIDDQFPQSFASSMEPPTRDC